MSFIPYGKQSIGLEEEEAVLNVLRSDFLTQGPKISEFEKALTDYTGAKYCVAVSSGTAALQIAVAALELESGSEFITTPNTFVATANAGLYAGLKPVLADIDAENLNISISKIEETVTDQTRVILPVHFAGVPVDVKLLKEKVKDRNIAIIEDAAHAIGSRYASGEKVGSCAFSDMTTFSFHPVKTITTGEGGAITTNSSELYQKLLLLRTHGITKDEALLRENPGPWFYEMQELSYNYRITDIQAALGIEQLKKLDSFVEKRRQIVEQYNNAFSSIDWLDTVKEPDGVYSAYHLYVVKINFERIGKNRSEAMDYLKDAGVGSQVHYIPVHFQPYYKNNFGFKSGDFPVSEEYYSRALSLPLYPSMNNEDVQTVIQAVFKMTE